MYNPGPNPQGSQPQSQDNPATNQQPVPNPQPQPQQPPQQPAQQQAAPQTPPEPTPQPQQQEQPEPIRIKPKPNPLPLIVAIVLVIAAAGSILYMSRGIISGGKTSTTYSSTTSQASIGSLSGCTTISKSGKYYLSYPFKATITSGACMNVTASNVSVICNGNALTGSGPFVGVPPFSYAVLINNQRNVTVSGCTLRNFSYGVFAASSNSVNVIGSNLSVNYMADVYLSNVHNGTIKNNYMSKSASTQGALYITNGTSGLDVLNNTVRYNQYYGININSSNNDYNNNYVNGTQYSFKCSTQNGFVISSKASSNICYNNTGCGFLQCRGINIPANVSKLTLSNSIKTCGSITRPGSYKLSSSLSMSQFDNLSNPLALQIPCISIASKNVQLDCNGFGIFNSTTAIVVNNRNNVTIQNCRIAKAKTAGLMLFNTTQAHISNVTLVNDSYGIELLNSSVDSFYNITSSKNQYGVYLSGSYANGFQLLNVTGNNYGVFLQGGSLSNNFNKGAITNNTKLDVFATPDSANATLNLMQSTACGLTNAVWATCRQFVFTSLPYVPVSSCRSINSPGNYLLSISLYASPQQCIRISSKNVQFNCANRTISSQSGLGSGISITNSVNVTVRNCVLQGFGTMLNVSNSNTLSISNIKTQGGFLAMSFSRVSSASVLNSTLNGSLNTSISIINTSSSSFMHNNITYGQPQSIAILLNNSAGNRLINNTGIGGYIGLEVAGRSRNNTVMNNTMTSDIYQDFLCSQGNSDLSAETGGINYGTKKSGCHWLAALVSSSPTIGCLVSQGPTLVTLSQDYKYGVGTTCFNMNSALTTIDCRGHTVLATNGGTFASFVNAQGSKMQNCFLKGFTVPLVASNSSISVLNNTISAGAAAQAAISVSYSRSGVAVRSNNVSSANVGISLYSLGSGSLLNNIVSNASTAYMLSNVSVFAIKNNTALPTASNGMIMINSIINQFQNNNLSSKGSALECRSTSQGALNNTDQGLNFCSVVLNCPWIKGSSSTCH